MKIEHYRRNGVVIVDAEVADAAAVTRDEIVELEKYLEENIVRPAIRLGMKVKRSKTPACYKGCIAHFVVEGNVSRMNGIFLEQTLVFIHQEEVAHDEEPTAVLG